MFRKHQSKGAPVELGLRPNWRQFTLLVLINAFVGGLVGLERTVVPLIAEHDFGLVSKSLVLSFLVSFGVVKALANVMAGRWSDRFGRKPILIAGWLLGLPVPLLIIYAPNWNWIVFANILLGINQGLCWSTTVIMKIDLVGPKQRGLAMGVNEFAGYLAVALAALASGYLAAQYGLPPAPFYPGLAFGLLGLLFSIFFVHETQRHVAQEAAMLPPAQYSDSNNAPASFRSVFWLTSWRNRTLFAASQAGLVNNLNDGVVWGMLPIFLAAAGLSLGQIGIIAAVYPGVWGNQPALYRRAQRPLGPQMDDRHRNGGAGARHCAVGRHKGFLGVAGRRGVVGIGHGAGLSHSAGRDFRRCPAGLARLSRGCLPPLARRGLCRGRARGRTACRCLQLDLRNRSGCRPHFSLRNHCRGRYVGNPARPHVLQRPPISLHKCHNFPTRTSCNPKGHFQRIDEPNC